MKPLLAAVPFSCLLAAPLLSQANTAAQSDAPIKQRIAAALATVDASRIEATIRTLVGFGTRHVLSRTDSDSEGTGAARKWLQSQFEAIAQQSAGRLVVSLQAETVPCARQGMPKEVPIVNV